MAFDIDLQFTDYGMSPAKVQLCDLPNSTKGMKFTDNDYFIIQPCEGELKYRNYYNSSTRTNETVFDKTYFAYFNGYPMGSYIEADFTYATGEIGVILRYNYSGFLSLRFHDNMVGLYRVVDQSLELIGREAPCPLIPNTVYTVKVEDMSNRINLYVGGIHISSFIVDDDEAIKQGLFGIYSSKDNICNKYNISTTKPTKWLTRGNPNVFGYEQSPSNISSLVVSAIADNSSESNYAYQSIPVDSNSKYSILFKAGGKSSKNITVPGKIVVYNVQGNSVIHSKDLSISEVYNTIQYNNTFTVPSNCSTIEVRVIPASSSTIGLDFVQINKGDVAPFVETADSVVTTNKSVINLPITLSKMDDLDIKLSFKPFSNSSDLKNVIVSFPSNDNTKHWIMYYNNSNNICVDYVSGGATTTYVTPSKVDIGLDNTITVTFNDGTIKIAADNYAPVIIETQVDQDPITFDIITTRKYFPEYTFDMIYLGYSSLGAYARGNAIYDYILGNIAGVLKFNYGFNGSIQERTGSIVSTIIGKPTQFAPISVEYDDGFALSRISSFDENGDYTRMQIEYVQYTGGKRVVVSCNDIDSKYEVPIICYTENQGRKNEVTYYYDFNRVDGNTIYIQMDDEQSTRLIGKTFKVIYCPSNSYSIAYNEDNTFKVILHSHRGRPINVSYEHAVIDKKLVKSAIMNPFYNPNHSGFLYLTDEVEPVSYLEVKVTPNYLDAKKQEYALIIIDAYDKRGNIVSDANIKITSKGEIGSIITPVSTGKDVNDLTTLKKVDMKFFAGRYIYKYSINKDYSGSNGYILKDILTITESNSKIIESASIYIYV